jgi:hypothetical protein
VCQYFTNLLLLVVDRIKEENFFIFLDDDGRRNVQL